VTPDEAAVRRVDAAVLCTIDKIVKATVGTPAGVEVYALLSVAVTIWVETGLPLDAIHDTIDSLAKAARAAGN
jgi:hypothetical protein